MSVSEAAKETLLGSIGALNASIAVGEKAAIATGNTVEAIGKTSTAVGNIIETNANNANNLTTSATDLAVASANTTAKFVDSLGNNSDKLVTSGADVTVTAVKSLTNMLANTNEITTTLIRGADDSLKKASPHVADSVGDATEMASTFTKTALETVKFSATVIITIFKVFTTPFELMNDKIKAIKKKNASPQNKLEEIRREYEKDYNITVKELQKNFITQIDNMIKNANNLLNLYKQLGCKKTFFGQYNCNGSTIENTITTINENYAKMLYEKTDFISKLKIIFDDFKSTSSMGWSVNEGNLDSKIDEMGNTLVNKQNEIIIEATDLLKETISLFKNNYLNPIKKSIEELNKPPEQATPTGGRPPRKSRQTKRNKKSKKTKSRRSK